MSNKYRVILANLYILVLYKIIQKDESRTTIINYQIDESVILF